MATILVTGGAGFIGANFIRYWRREHPGDRVVNYDLLTYAASLESLADVAVEAGAKYAFVKGDIGDYPHALATLRQHAVETVVNFAAESHNSRAIVDPAVFFRTNVLGTVELMRAALDAGVQRFHHVSTCEVYGDLPLDATESFTEASPLLPRTPYNASKAGADLAVGAFCRTYGLAATISSCANNYGAYQFPEKVIPHFVVNALQNKPLTLYRSSRNKREWLHVEDHCRAIDRILEAGEVGHTYNVGSGVEVDVEGIADRVLALLGRDPSLKTYVPDRPSHDRRYLLDATKLRSTLGWRPTVEFEAGFGRTVAWYRDHPQWWQPLLARSQVDEAAWQPRRAAPRPVPIAGR